MSDVSATAVRQPEATRATGWLAQVAGLVGLFVVCVVFAALGAVGVDRLTSRSEEAAQPAFEDPVWVPKVQTGAAASEEAAQAQAEEVSADPGAVVELGVGPTVAGLPTDRWVLPADVVLPEGATTTTTVPSPDGTVPPSSETTASSSEPATSGGEAGTTVEPFVPAEQAADMAKQWGETAAQGVPWVKRFVDQCAEGLGVCPLGEPGTVVPFDGSTAPPPLQIKLWPGMTKATVPTLRCDPGYYTSDRLPVVITANQHLYDATVVLSVAGVGMLDEITISRQPAETAWYLDQVKAASPLAVGTDLANGTQYCASLRTQGDPEVAAKLAGATLPSPLVYHLEATAHSDVPSNPWGTTGTAKASIDHTAPPAAGRPPVLLTPLNGNVLQVVVPQKDIGTVRSEVTATMSYLGCAAPTDPTSGGPSVGGPGSPVEYDAAQLARPDYPYDRAYAAYTVWNLVLQSYNTSTVCVHLTEESPPDDALEWVVSTPHAMRLRFDFGVLRQGGAGRIVGGADIGYYPTDPSSPRGGLELYTSNSGCNTLYPGRYLGKTAYTEEFCPSNGYPYPMYTVFQMQVFDRKSKAVLDKGKAIVFTPTWCEPVTPLSPTDIGYAATSVAYALAQIRCNRDVTYQAVTFEWRDSILYSGDFPSEHILADLDGVLVTQGISSGHRGQLDWEISEQVRVVAPEAP